jgi:hypothetical protein
MSEVPWSGTPSDPRLVALFGVDAGPVLPWPDWLADMPDRERLRKIMAAVHRCYMEHPEGGVVPLDPPPGSERLATRAAFPFADFIEDTMLDDGPGGAP